MTRLPKTHFRDNPYAAHGKRPGTRYAVVHTIEGSDEGAEAWFKNRQAQGLAAQVIVGQTQTVQITDLDNLCYHAHSEGNSWGVGFEHEGSAHFTKKKWMDKSNRRLLRNSAARVAWVCYHYHLGTPTLKKNVLGHVHVPGNDHTDPGKGWPWWFYIWLCRRAYKNLVKSHGKTWNKN